MEKPGLVFLLIGNINRDGRVRKEISFLKEKFDISLIQFQLSSPISPNTLGIRTINFSPGIYKFPLLNFFKKILFNFFALKHLFNLKPAYVHCNDLDTFIAGALYHRKSKIVFDVHELYPESQTGINKTIWSFIEKLVIKRCMCYILPEKNRINFFRKKHGIPNDLIYKLENFPTRDYKFSKKNILRETFHISPDDIIIFYSGLLSNGRHIEEIIKSMNILPKNYSLVFLGPQFKGYINDLNHLIASEHLGDRVYIHQPIDNSEMLNFINACDIGIVFYKNTNLNNYYCASNKLYEFIMCQKPMVTNNYPGLLEVVEKNQLGACIDIVNPETIATAIKEIKHLKPKRDCPEYIWENQVEILSKIYKQA